MHKQVKAFYDVANEYYLAAATLWAQIVDAPYLYNPISYLLRHTIELQLKGLIVFELKREDGTFKISEIVMPNGTKMNGTHSISALWEYYKQLFLLHNLPIFESEFQMCDRVLSRLNKADCSSTYFRYPFTKDDVLANYKPIHIRCTDIVPDISKGTPSLIIQGANTCIIRKGRRLIADTQERFEVVQFLFKLFNN